MCKFLEKLVNIKYVGPYFHFAEGFSGSLFVLKPFHVSSFLFLWASFVALGQNAVPPVADSPAQNQIQAPEEQPQTVSAAVDSNSYRVGAGDVLNIRVWHEQEFSGPVSVHPDGNITMPLLGDLAIGGKTPVAIEQVITQALTKFVVKPRVTVTVQQVVSKKYYLDGEVARAGEYTLVTPTTVLEAISKAGGLREFASEKKIYILRGDKRIPFNYKEVTHGKHMEQNVQLEAGDHVIVP